MKKIIYLLFIVSILSIREVNAQSVPDTLAYLQTIVANKSQFIGQPFSVLKNSLQIQIKYFQPFAAINHYKNRETSTSFAFYFPNNADELYLTFPKIEVYWEPYLNIVESLGIAQGNRGVWSPAAEDFYANGVIRDIRLRD